jgi:hypothetical protein
MNRSQSYHRWTISKIAPGEIDTLFMASGRVNKARQSLKSAKEEVTRHIPDANLSGFLNELLGLCEECVGFVPFDGRKPVKSRISRPAPRKPPLIESTGEEVKVDPAAGKSTVESMEAESSLDALGDWSNIEDDRVTAVKAPPAKAPVNPQVPFKPKPDWKQKPKASGVSQSANHSPAKNVQKKAKGGDKVPAARLAPGRLLRASDFPPVLEFEKVLEVNWSHTRSGEPLWDSSLRELYKQDDVQSASRGTLHRKDEGCALCNRVVDTCDYDKYSSHNKSQERPWPERTPWLHGDQKFKVVLAHAYNALRYTSWTAFLRDAKLAEPASKTPNLQDQFLPLVSPDGSIELQDYCSWSNRPLDKVSAAGYRFV